MNGDFSQCEVIKLSGEMQLVIGEENGEGANFDWLTNVPLYDRWPTHIHIPCPRSSNRMNRFAGFYTVDTDND